MPLFRRQPFCVLPGMPLEYHKPEERAMQTLSVEAGIRYRDCCRLAETGFFRTSVQLKPPKHDPVL